jgi:hypothetical protein
MLLCEYSVMPDGKISCAEEAAGTAALLNRISCLSEYSLPRERAARRNACDSFSQAS